MTPAPRIPVTVIRHPKERLSKCSLRPLHGRPEITFLRATPGFTFDASGFLLLEINAPVLQPADAGRPLLILDSTWRYLPALRACLTGAPIPRSLPPGITTAYPRRSRLAPDPQRGLASVEALYAAKRLLGEDDPTLLDGYYWKAQFLAQLGGPLSAQSDSPPDSPPGAQPDSPSGAQSGAARRDRR